MRGYSMGYCLEIDGGGMPPHPHIFCAGGPDLEGRGWAWHDDPRWQRCFSADAVAAPAPLVAAAIDGRELAGIDRLLAIAELRQEISNGYLRVFRSPCPACGANHRERADRACRVVRHIHPDVVPLLREARVPEGRLREPRYLRRGSLAEDRKDRKDRQQSARARRIPVWPGDVERTRLAQLAFASKCMEEYGCER